MNYPYIIQLFLGDLTDAKTPDGEGSTQYEQEWIVYRDILYHTEIPEKVLWLDIRGNHGILEFIHKFFIIYL